MQAQVVADTRHTCTVMRVSAALTCGVLLVCLGTARGAPCVNTTARAAPLAISAGNYVYLCKKTHTHISEACSDRFYVYVKKKKERTHPLRRQCIMRRVHARRRRGPRVRC